MVCWITSSTSADVVASASAAAACVIILVRLLTGAMPVLVSSGAGLIVSFSMVRGLQRRSLVRRLRPSQDKPPLFRFRSSHHRAAACFSRGRVGFGDGSDGLSVSPGADTAARVTGPLSVSRVTGSSARLPRNAC